MTEKCSKGRTNLTGSTKAAGCNKKPERGSIYCPVHRLEAWARVVPDDRVRPWPGLPGGYKRKYGVMAE